jgi:hypothetical protein
LPRQARDKHGENSKQYAVFRTAAVRCSWWKKPSRSLMQEIVVTLFLSGFPMFVPSLSWQNNAFLA